MKTMLSPEMLDAQSALALPSRELMLVTIVITNLLNNLSIEVNVKNNNVAVQVCAVVQAITTAGFAALSCEIRQR